MAGQASGASVVAAIFGNGVIAALKIMAFLVSGSGAMLAEGIHSIADTANQALLWVGIRRSERPPDDDHPYGYGAERYVWSLISAMGIFFLGCGVTVYHGIHQLLHPEVPNVGWLTWAVLAISVLVEGGVLMMAIREANRAREGKGWLEYIRTSSDPTLIAVLFEDSVAVFGVFVAAAGIGLSRFTGIGAFDGVASIIIGLLLGALALVLAAKNSKLLVGQRADPETEERIRRLIERHPAVGKIVRLRTRVMAAGAHRVDLQVDFDADTLVDRMRDDIMRKAGDVKTPEDLVAFSRAFGADLIDELAVEVDRIEDLIKEEVPTASLIDVEGD
jgi:zinc transporter 9